jgi:hypothetical protein
VAESLASLTLVAVLLEDVVGTILRVASTIFRQIALAMS